MSKKNINEEIVAKEAAKRFRMLCEYTFNLTEDDGEEMPAPEEGADAGMGAEGGMPAPADNGMEGGMPGPDAAMGGAPEQGGDMNAMPPAEGEGGAPGFNPEEGAGAESGMPDDAMGAEPMQSDDEVIDVDELTQSQEETEDKVDNVKVTMEKGFEKILSVVSKLNQMIDTNSANMEDLKREMEKRNPTPLEKLNMRAANDSYPFNVSPESYWADKEANSNYRIGGEDEPDAEQYTITQGDIDSITDFSQISKDLNDASFNQNLLNIFGLR